MIKQIKKSTFITPLIINQTEIVIVRFLPSNTEKVLNRDVPL